MLAGCSHNVNYVNCTKVELRHRACSTKDHQSPVIVQVEETISVRGQCPLMTPSPTFLGAELLYESLCLYVLCMYVCMYVCRSVGHTSFETLIFYNLYFTSDILIKYEFF